MTKNELEQKIKQMQIDHEREVSRLNRVREKLMDEARIENQKKRNLAELKIHQEYQSIIADLVKWGRNR